MNVDETVLERARLRFNDYAHYGYCDLTGAFPAGTLKAVAKDIESVIQAIAPERNIYGSFRKHRLSRLDEMPASAAQLIGYLNSAAFLQKLEQVSGIPDLLPDPALQGGGIHVIQRGGFLKLHTDFNWHAGLQAHRRLNLLIYLNEDWQPEWGGHIELWSPDVKHQVFSMSPTLGNALLFATNDHSYHGHPDPLDSPEGVSRKSIALYYYTKERPVSEVVFGKSEMTNYVTRPNEHFDQDRLRSLYHRFKLRLKRLLSWWRSA